LAEKNVLFFGSDVLFVARRNKPPERLRFEYGQGSFQIKERRFLPLQPGSIFGGADKAHHLATLTSPDPGSVYVVNLETDKTIKAYEGYPQAWDALMHPTLEWIAISYSNSGRDSVSIVSSAGTTEIATGAGSVLSYSKQLRRLVTTGNKGALVWNCDNWTSTALEAPIVPRQVATAAYSPTGEYLAVAMNSTVWLLDATTNRPVAALTSRGVENQEFRLRFNDQGDLLALQGQDNSVWLWNLKLLEAKLRDLNLHW
jgi:WD40 repeat protein